MKKTQCQHKKAVPAGLCNWLVGSLLVNCLSAGNVFPMLVTCFPAGNMFPMLVTCFPADNMFLCWERVFLVVSFSCC